MAMVRTLSIWLMLVGAILLAPAIASPVIVSDAPSLDLSRQVEWCESGIDLSVSAIAAGGCRFAPAAPDALLRGFTDKTLWLRLTLVNPAARDTERWLQIGHHRLTHVSYFEKTSNGWRHTETGMAVPLAKRPIPTIDPILPVVLAPFEHRTVLVRVNSLATMDLRPVLWQVAAYYQYCQERDFKDTAGVGGLIASAIVLFAVYLLWHARAYLYFSGTVTSTIALTVSYSGLLQLHLWPADWPFSLDIQIIAAGCTGIAFALFAAEFTGARRAFPIHHALLQALNGCIGLAVAWTCLVDYRLTATTVMSLTMLAMINGTILLWRGWQPRSLRIGVLLSAISLFIAGQLYIMALNVSHGNHAYMASISNFWDFLLACMPAALIGLIVHKQQMQAQLQATQAESAARINFLASMSHELRTPLDIIIGTAQLLLLPSQHDRWKEGLADISANGRQLLKMIDEVLDYARGLVGKLAIVPDAVDWRVFLHNLEHDAKILAARNGNTATLVLNGGPLDCIKLDERRLKQILDNLLANAARHTKNGTICVECAAGPLRPDGKRQIAFAVTDSGEGIAREDIERIFQPFERGGNTAQRGGKGVGMGLTISRQLAELMGGALTVRSVIGKGSCFRFHVLADPANRADIKPMLPEHISGYTGPRRTVLLVDDEHDNRVILATMLRERGFNVAEAESGRAAIAQFGQTPVDAVLTDQFMAEGDGWYVLREIAQRQPDVPVVLISAAPAHRPAGFSKELDFSGHLLKPLDHSEVLRRIGNLLKIDWIEATSAVPLSERPLQRPSAAALQELRAMIETGRVTDILAWAEKLSASDPACKRFADKVRSAARVLDLASLADLAESEPEQTSRDANV